MKLKKGQRVEHAYLGKGTVYEDQKRGSILVLVLFDNNPHIRYNMGQNPTVEFSSVFKLITESQEQQQ